MAKNSSINFYDSHYLDPQSAKHKQVQSAYLLKLLKTISWSGKRVLDVGCGLGELGFQLNQLGAKAYGLDISASAVKQSHHRGVIARRWDIEKPWPYTSHTFDAVFIVQVIEHVINPDHLLTEAARILKPGGYLIVTTPNLACWFNRLLLLIGCQPFFQEVSTREKTFGLGFTRRLTPNRTPLGHLHCFTLSALVDMLLYYKFSHFECRGGQVLYLPGPLALLDRVFSHFPSLATDLIVVARSPHDQKF